MGSRNSKKSFTEWDLMQFSNVTGKYLTIFFITVYEKFVDEFRHSSVDG